MGIELRWLASAETSTRLPRLQFKQCGEGFTWVDVPLVVDQPQTPELICHRCKVDRFKNPCPDNSLNCSTRGEAQ